MRRTETLVLLFFAAAMLLMCIASGGCCKPGSSSTFCRVEAAAVDCAKADGAAVDSVLPAVLALLTSGGADWEALLAALAGPSVNVLTCAVTKAVAILESPRLAVNNQLAAKGAMRGRAFLARRGIQVKP